MNIQENHNLQLNLIALYTNNDNLRIENLKNYLKKCLNTPLNNISQYDLINYEKLIYIYINYQEEEEIMQDIELLFNKIANNYEIKEKIKKRLSLQNSF